MIFEDWRVNRTAPFQGCGTLTFNKHAFRQALPSETTGTRPRVKCAAGAKSKSFPRNATETATRGVRLIAAFHRRANRSRVVDVLAQIPAGVDPRNDDVRLFLQQRVECQDHGVGGRAFHREFAFGKLFAINRLPQRERLRRGAAFLRRRNHRDRADLAPAPSTSARRPGA